MKNIISSGSYLVIKRLSIEGETVEGEIYISNSKKSFSIGNIVYYLISDVKSFSLGDIKLDAVLYYNIVAQLDPLMPEIMKKESEKDVFCFNGLTV